MAALDAVAVAAVDTTGQLRELLDLPEHLSDALWRVESAGIQRGYSEGGIVFAGAGGTGAGGTLAAAILDDRARRPVLAVTDGVLPPWVDGTWTVLLSSYSGETPATLEVWDAATRSGARRIVASTGGSLVERARAAKVPVIPVPGGFRARHAIGYWTVIALEAARLCGAAPPLAEEVEAAAGVLRELAGDWAADGPDDSDPKTLARGLSGGIPVVLGDPALAGRLAAQIRINAGRPAFAADGPVPIGDAPLVPVTFGDADGEGLRITVGGATRTEQVLRRSWLADLASVYLAVLAGHDPGSS